MSANALDAVEDFDEFRRSERIPKLRVRHIESVGSFVDGFGSNS